MIGAQTSKARGSQPQQEAVYTQAVYILCKINVVKQVESIYGGSEGWNNVGADSIRDFFLSILFADGIRSYKNIQATQITVIPTQAFLWDFRLRGNNGWWEASGNFQEVRLRSFD